MTNTIPNWLMKKYSALWNKYNEKEFTFKQTIELLKTNDRIFVGIIISRLRKAGWIKTAVDKGDSRKRIYTLISPEKAIKKIR